MSYALDYAPIAAQASESARAAFIRRTYGHVAGAVLAFAALEAALLQIPGIDQFVFSMSRMWIVAVLGMVAAGWVARAWANSNTSIGMQYLGLSLYVVVEAVCVLPLLYYCTRRIPNADHLIATAGILTLGIFGGLTATVFLTRSDFSYLAPILSCAGFLSIGLLVCASLFGFSLGLWFSFAMVALACGFILYDTSNVLHHYRTDQHVGAALELFASIVVLFIYILRILMSARDN